MTEQGTQAWFDARRGKITASMFAVATSTTRGGSPTEAARQYAIRVAADRLGWGSGPRGSSKEMQHGTETEPRARLFYIEQMPASLSIEMVGFLLHPGHPEFGGSPDALLGEDGGLEIKSPYHVHRHWSHLCEIEQGRVPDEYKAQVQGLLWITGRKWWDFMSFMEAGGEKDAVGIVRVERDEDYINTLACQLLDFNDLVVKEMERRA